MELKNSLLDNKVEEEESIESTSSGEDKIKELLQRQVNHEFDNERLYLAMSFWLEEHGYVETAKFFSKHSKEERKHAMDFINFMNKMRYPVDAIEGKKNRRDYENVCDLLNAAMDREKQTSKMIGEIHTAALKGGHLALTIAGQYLREQAEEEQLFFSLINLCKLAGESKFDFETEVRHIKKSGKFKVAEL